MYTSKVLSLGKNSFLEKIRQLEQILKNEKPQDNHIII